MPPHGKQLVLLYLLATRSYLRYKLEGAKDPTTGTYPNAPASGNDVLTRIKNNLPTGITAADINQYFSGLGALYVPIGDTRPQIGRVSTGINDIMNALGLAYNPDLPDCPSNPESDLISPAIIANIP